MEGDTKVGIAAVIAGLTQGLERGLAMRRQNQQNESEMQLKRDALAQERYLKEKELTVREKVGTEGLGIKEMIALSTVMANKGNLQVKQTDVAIEAKKENRLKLQGISDDIAKIDDQRAKGFKELDRMQKKANMAEDPKDKLFWDTQVQQQQGRLGDLDSRKEQLTLDESETRGIPKQKKSMISYPVEIPKDAHDAVQANINILKPLNESLDMVQTEEQLRTVISSPTFKQAWGSHPEIKSALKKGLDAAKLRVIQNPTGTDTGQTVTFGK